MIPSRNSDSVLVLGATGYVGSRLVPRLLERGHKVRVLVRNADKLWRREWRDSIEVLTGDVLDRESVERAMKQINYVYYLVHSMGSSVQFQEQDRKAAKIVSTAASHHGARRIVYLGGLGSRNVSHSAHLSSRHEVGDLLRSGTTPVTELRAAVIVGSGSISFELIHHLVNRLPAMICPKWVYSRTQPIAIRDVLTYLIASIDNESAAGESIDIGGPDVMTYRDMMLGVAEVLGLRRYLFSVPVLTPRLSSYWVNLVTPIGRSLARALIDSLRSETICENNKAHGLYDLKPIGFREAAELALRRVQVNDIESVWTDAGSTVSEPIDASHLKEDKRERIIIAPAQAVFEEVSSIGGSRGWYYADWLWRTRGFIDQQLGGVGIRRGRRHPILTSPGEALDFWRVEQYDVPHVLLLKAEMKVWGQAWLKFEVTPIDNETCRLTQTASYYPRGLIGLAYWYGVLPLHVVVFSGLLRAIARRSESRTEVTAI